jgi:hypothetical protein
VEGKSPIVDVASLCYLQIDRGLGGIAGRLGSATAKLEVVGVFLPTVHPGALLTGDPVSQ